MAWRGGFFLKENPLGIVASVYGNFENAITVPGWAQRVE
jgi:hypothetical protein